MRRTASFLALVLGLTGPGPIAFAHHAHNVSTLSTSETDEETSGPTGGIDLRPSYAVGTQNAYSMNVGELGYQFSKDFLITYQQWFFSYYWNGPQAPGSAFQAFDGRVRTQLNNLWLSGDRTWHLDENFEVLLPMDPIKRSAGLVGSLRFFTTLTKSLSSRASVSLTVAPMLYDYTQTGSLMLQEDGTQSPTPNQLFENLSAVTFTYIFGRSGFAASLPVYFDTVRYANYAAAAKYNNSWDYGLFVYPEVTYTTSENLTFGVAYQSDSLHLQNVSDGTGYGTARFIVRTSF